MANNVEKFVIDLGFSAKDLKQLKELLQLQEKADKDAPKRKNNAAKQARDQLKSEQAINKLGQATRKVHEDILKAQQSQTKELKKQSNITQKQFNNMPPRSLFEQDQAKKAKDLKRQIKEQADSEKILANLGKGTRNAHEQAVKFKEKELATEKKITKEVTQRQFNNMPPRKLFEKAQADRDRQERAEIDRRKGADIFAREVAVSARRKGLSDSQVESLKEQARQAFGTRLAVKELKVTLQELGLAQQQATMRARKHNLALQGLNDSTRHLIRSYASVFAVMGTGQAIKTSAQGFQSMESAMLAATGTSQAAADEIAFLDKMTSRLGLSLLDTSDAYTKFLFASKGKLDQSETRELFEGLSELGTTLGISKDRMKLSMIAITQMMNKTKISSDELKNQLAESLPGSIQIFARALNMSELEMFKMMEQGQLLAEDVLPKVAKEMKAVAAVGLEQKLERSRVAEGMFLNELQKAGNTIFNGTLEKSYSNLLNALTETLRNSELTLKSIGETAALVLNIIKIIATGLLPVMKATSTVLGSISHLLNIAFGDETTQNVLALAVAIGAVVKAVRVLTLAMKSQLAVQVGLLLTNPAAWPFLAAAGVTIGGSLAYGSISDAMKDFISERRGGTPAVNVRRNLDNAAASTKGSFGTSNVKNDGTVNVTIKTEDGLEGRIVSTVESLNTNARVEVS